MNRLLLSVAGFLGTAASAWAGPGDLFAEKVHDFGTTPKGPVLVHYFRFTNTTNQTLTLGTPRVSCGCVSASVSQSRVAPGETAAVIAHMDTRRITTPNVTKTVTVYVPFSGPTQEEVSLRVQTVNRDDLMMSPDTLALGSLKCGEGGKCSTKVTFTSDPNWKVTEVTSTGGFVKAEVKEDSRVPGMVTYEVTAVLDKGCPAGNWISEVHLKTSNKAVEKLRIPVTVNVTPAVAITPDSASFGNVPVGRPAERTISLKSGTPFKILEVKGADDQLQVKIDKDASAEHKVVFAANPKAVGGFSRTVELVTDSKEQPKIVIPVTALVVQK